MPCCPNSTPLLPFPAPPAAKPLWGKGRPGAVSRGSPILATVERLEEKSLEYVWLTVVLAHPTHVASTLQRQELMNRGSLLYKVRSTPWPCAWLPSKGPSLPRALRPRPTH